MARLPLVITQLPGSKDPASVTITWNTLVVLDGGEWDLHEGDILLAQNPDGGAPLNVTLKGAADLQNRTADSVKAVPDNGAAVFGPLKREGWAQANGKANVDIADVATQIAVLRA